MTNPRFARVSDRDDAGRSPVTTGCHRRCGVRSWRPSSLAAVVAAFVLAACGDPLPASAPGLRGDGGGSPLEPRDGSREGGDAAPCEGADEVAGARSLVDGPNACDPCNRNCAIASDYPEASELTPDNSVDVVFVDGVTLDCSSGTCPTTGRYARDYAGSEHCVAADEFRPDWGVFHWEVRTPGDTAVLFEIRTADDEAGLDTAVPVSFRAPPFSSDINVGDMLVSAGLANLRDRLRISAVLVPGAGNTAPTLNGFALQFECVTTSTNDDPGAYMCSGAPPFCDVVCGDFMVAGEACDEGAVDTATCDADCSAVVCGDYYVNLAAGEACDEGGIDTATCTSTCRVSTCGDSYVNPSSTEQCDEGGVDTPTCNADCTVAGCGDRYVNGARGEDCDQGGVDTPTCDADCTMPRCGDGRVNMAALEECDDGGPTTACSATCTVAFCGNGVVEAALGETCDTAGVESGTCDLDCTPVACGDGVRNVTAGESCDEGGVDTATCNADCTPVVCGDGIVNFAAGEECEEGGVTTADCDADCTWSACGDGVANVLAGESCDTAGDSVTCDADCSVVTCGDGYVNAAAGEACEAGAVDAPACDRDCTMVVCGDGVINAASGEQCDDANEDSADGCSSVCTVEPFWSCAGEPSGCVSTCPDRDLGSVVGRDVAVGTTSGATNEIGGGWCGSSVAGEQTYRFVAPATGEYTFSTEGSTYDTVVYVLDGGTCAGALLGCNDDADFGMVHTVQSRLTLTLTSGQAVLVGVDGYLDRVGAYVLHIETGEGGACDDGLDNDLNGLTDCADTRCNASTCGPNGRVCATGACVCPGGGVETSVAQCGDGTDDDCDGAVDCADSDCAGVSCGGNGLTCAGGVCACPGGGVETSAAQCSDGIDDDCDGAVDCADSDCAGVSCGGSGLTCTGGACVCPGGGVETSAAQCSDGIDDDCDGAVDCTDTNCFMVACAPGGFVCEVSGTCVCGNGGVEASALQCADGVDNDCDGAVDCADSVCGGVSCGAAGLVCDTASGLCVCPHGGVEDTATLCVNGVDDDCDGTTDCGDAACDGLACGASGLVCDGGACVCLGAGAETTGALCGNGTDDDCDGAIDCEEATCDGLSCRSGGWACQAGACTCDHGPVNETNSARCGDGVDNDCDGLVDCADPNCEGTTPCP